MLRNDAPADKNKKTLDDEEEEGEEAAANVADKSGSFNRRSGPRAETTPRGLAKGNKGV